MTAYVNTFEVLHRLANDTTSISHPTHNQLFHRSAFPGNQVHWYREPNTQKQKFHIYVQKHKSIQFRLGNTKDKANT